MTYNDVKYKENRDKTGNLVNYTMNYNGERLGTTEKVSGGFSFTPHRADKRLQPVTVPRMIDIRVKLSEQMNSVGPPKPPWYKPLMEREGKAAKALLQILRWVGSIGYATRGGQAIWDALRPFLGWRRRHAET